MVVRAAKNTSERASESLVLSSLDSAKKGLLAVHKSKWRRTLYIFKV